MAIQTPVSEIMTKDVFVINANDPIMEIERTFRNHHLRHAPVVSDDELVGMLSLIDIKRKEDSDDFSLFEVPEEASPADRLKVQQLMTPNPVSVQSHATVKEVATIFIDNEFHALPVMDGERIVGIISTTDVIRFLLENTGRE